MRPRTVSPGISQITHITLYAPLRSRKREYPPLCQHELPTDLDNFLVAMSNCLMSVSPFTIKFSEVNLTPIEHIVIQVKGITAVKSSLIKALTPFLGTDVPKSDPKRIHGTIGYLYTLPTIADTKRLKDALAQINQAHISHMLVEQIWLVHYAHRTLNQVVGKIPFILGEPKPISTHHFLQALSIANDLQQPHTLLDP